MVAQRRNDASQGAFTLVEMLVVLVIIGLLAGLTTTVVVSARRNVNASVVSMMEAQLTIALEEYKNRYGEYPPDFSDPDAVMRHVRKRWPRYNVPDYDSFMGDIWFGSRLSSSGVASPLPSDMDELFTPSTRTIRPKPYVSALVFWLGGLPDENGVPSGFYAASRCPLGVVHDRTDSKKVSFIQRPERAKREPPLYSFEKKYLKAYTTSAPSSVDTPMEGDGSTLNEVSEAYCPYAPAYCQGGRPILYFRPSPNSPYGKKNIYYNTGDEVSCAVPYARGFSKSGSGVDWYGENRFQLIHPGADGLFGNSDYGNTPDAARMLQPRSATVGMADDDNVVNFVEQGTLENEYK